MISRMFGPVRIVIADCGVGPERLDEVATSLRAGRADDRRGAQRSYLHGNASDTAAAP